MILMFSDSSGKDRTSETKDESIGFTSLIGIAKFKFSPLLTYESCYADHFPCHVEQRAAAAAGGYRRGDLQEFIPSSSTVRIALTMPFETVRFERKGIAYPRQLPLRLGAERNLRELTCESRSHAP